MLCYSEKKREEERNQAELLETERRRAEINGMLGKLQDAADEAAARSVEMKIAEKTAIDARLQKKLADLELLDKTTKVKSKQFAKRSKARKAELNKAKMEYLELARLVRFVSVTFSWLQLRSYWSTCCFIPGRNERKSGIRPSCLRRIGAGLRSTSSPKTQPTRLPPAVPK